MSDIKNDAANPQLIDQDLAQAEHSESNDESNSRNLSTPGRLLRAGRESKELAISSVGKQLKLDTRVVEALERDDFDSIGAPVFVKGHLRKYASFVGINPDDVMLSYYQVARTKDATPIISQTMPMSDPRPKFAWVGKLLTGLVVIALIAALIYALYRGWNWYLADAELSSTETSSNARASSLSLPGQDGNNTTVPVTSSANNFSSDSTDGARTLSLPPQSDLDSNTAELVVNTNAFVNGSEGSDTEASKSILTDTPSNPDSNQSLDRATELTLPTQVAEQTSNIATSANSATAVAGDSLRLVFLENCWVNIKGENGRSLMNGIGYQGDSREFVLSGETEIHLGNADGVQLFLNGQTYQVPRRARSGKTALFQLVPRS